MSPPDGQNSLQIDRAVVVVEKYNNNLDNLIFCARYFNLKKLNREQINKNASETEHHPEHFSR